MKKTKIRKLIAITACTAALFAVGGALAACDGEWIIDDGIEFVEEEVKSGPQFLDGALDVVTVGDTIRLDYYIDYVKDAQYTITLTNEAGEETNLTRKKIWKAEEAGEYTITYTIQSGKQKGTNTFTLTVVYPELKWEFVLQRQPYLFGETLSFEKYLEDLNIYIFDRPEEDYTIQMESVTVDGVETLFNNGETEYTFDSMEDHTFKFSATTIDGQRIEAREVISIKYIDTQYSKTLEDMGITYEGELRVQDGNYTMLAGSYANGNNVWLRNTNGPHKSPYIAYNGDYGIGSYVTVDFSGDNMPIFSFFREDDYSQSMFDGTKGWVYTGGFKNNSGAPIHESMCARNTVYGPYMLEEYDRNGANTITFGSMSLDVIDENGKSVPMRDENGNVVPYPGSLKSLQNGTHYRMIAGFSKLEVAKGVPHHIEQEARKVDSFKLTFSCAIINLDTYELVTRFDLQTYAIQACDRLLELSTEDMDAAYEYFSGNIVLYGNYGETTTLDKIYPITTNRDKSFDQLFADEFEAATFKANAPNFIVDANTELKVSDFVDVTAEDYIFFYRNEKGETVHVTENTFSFGEEGSYTLYYSDGVKLCATHNIFVVNYSEEVLTWIKQNGVSLYGVDDLTDGASVTLKAGTLAFGGNPLGPNAGNYVDQGYIAFNGNYSFDDYIAFDFTGKNMPEVAFFAQNYNNSMYYQNGGKKGIVVVTGITSWDGSEIINTNLEKTAGTTINYSYPFMIQNAADGGFTSGAFADSKLGRANLVDGTHYRVIVGFTGSGTAITLHWYLYNMDTNEVVEQSSMATWDFFTGTNGAVNNMTISDLFGSIVLYGKFGTTCTIDKIHGVFEDTTIDKIVTALDSTEKYTVVFKNEAGETLETVEVDAGEYPVYTGKLPTPSITEDALFTYAYGWDKPLARALKDTVYTVKLIATLKDGVAVTKYKTRIQNGVIILDAGIIGEGANYTQGQNAGGNINQAYLAFDGEYSFDDYIVFDFTGKNMPEVMFFAKNYDSSMYYSAGKQGVVVASGITLWDGSTGSAQTNNTMVGVSGPFGAYYMSAEAPHGGNMLADFSAQLARANLVDGTQYRVIMGITKAGDSAFSLKYMLYNLTAGTVVEEVTQTSWEFFTGVNGVVNNMTLNDLVGSIVLYGKFDGQDPITATTTIDRVLGVYNDTSITEICKTLGMNAQ